MKSNFVRFLRSINVLVVGCARILRSSVGSDEGRSVENKQVYAES